MEYISLLLHLMQRAVFLNMRNMLKYFFKLHYLGLNKSAAHTAQGQITDLITHFLYFVQLLIQQDN